MLFWGMTIVLVLVAAVFVFYPLISRKDKESYAHKELNKVLYQERIDEVSHEDLEGLHFTKSEIELDLKRALLEDIPESRLTTTSSAKSRRTLPILSLAVIAIIGVAYGVYSQTGGIKQVDEWHAVINNMPELTQKLLQQETQPLTREEVQSLMLGLRTKLYSHPDDAVGWMLLGKVALSQGQAEVAIDALRKAYQLNPERDDIVVTYAQALLSAPEEGNQNHGVDLLKNLVAQGRNQEMAYTFLFAQSYQKGDLPAAQDYLQHVYDLLDKSSPKAQYIKQQIAQINSKIEESAVNNKKFVVTVSVDVDKHLVLPKQGALIVSVHQDENSRMPIAAKRVSLPDKFPVNLSLSDQNDLIAALKLSDLKSFVIRARIDIDGNVTTNKGDLVGESGTASPGNQVNIIINKQY
ncbi:c-type cytochrome biogenesis protein CcmI [Vibrio viridaestus]|uniref:C-type cytochrome biogenesis protein CcmI n=1 Tax=Vibrio viridaestus TaxID=2487322 RepID=A0A3N9TJ42_9VIBR|nr:c-type cytochrome biogenesis protein CcmI [Vibrio viridaestus]RQW64171.1 c-type cytochrome biogenesis protein CcmI [Vibrio viridaestus]